MVTGKVTDLGERGRSWARPGLETVLRELPVCGLQRSCTLTPGQGRKTMALTTLDPTTLTAPFIVFVPVLASQAFLLISRKYFHSDKLKQGWVNSQERHLCPRTRFPNVKPFTSSISVPWHRIPPASEERRVGEI